MSRKKASIVYRVTDAQGGDVAIVIGRSPKGAVHTAQQLGHKAARHAFETEQHANFAHEAINYKPKKEAAQ